MRIPPGRFMMEDLNHQGSADDRGGGSDLLNRAWVIVETDKAIDKVMHRLREKMQRPLHALEQELAAGDNGSKM